MREGVYRVKKGVWTEEEIGMWERNVWVCVWVWRKGLYKSMWVEKDRERQGALHKEIILFMYCTVT